jgi:amidase
MARTVPDVGRAFGILVGPDARAPAALPAGVVTGLGAAIAADADLHGHRVAVSVDFGGLAPVEQAVAEATRSAARTLASLGCEVTEASPDFSSLNEVIAGTRALGIMLRYSAYTKAQLDKLSPRLRAQIDDVAPVDLASVARAERLRSTLFLEFHRFMRDYDYLLTPTWGVVPFRIDVPFDYMMDGHETPNYFDCILFTYAMSVLGTPSISVPAGVDANNLPIGIQIAGPRYSDSMVLSAAAAFESARGEVAWPPKIDVTRLRPADSMFVESGGSVAWRSLDANKSGSD